MVATSIDAHPSRKRGTVSQICWLLIASQAASSRPSLAAPAHWAQGKPQNRPKTTYTAKCGHRSAWMCPGGDSRCALEHVGSPPGQVEIRLKRGTRAAALKDHEGPQARASCSAADGSVARPAETWSTCVLPLAPTPDPPLSQTTARPARKPTNAPTPPPAGAPRRGASQSRPLPPARLIRQSYGKGNPDGFDTEKRCTRV